MPKLRDISRFIRCEAVPTVFYSRDPVRNYTRDEVRMVPGWQLGPLGVSKGTYGWSVVHFKSAKRTHESWFRRLGDAKDYAVGILAIPGAERHVDSRSERDPPKVNRAKMKGAAYRRLMDYHNANGPHAANDRPRHRHAPSP